MNHIAPVSASGSDQPGNCEISFRAAIRSGSVMAPAYRRRRLLTSHMPKRASIAGRGAAGLRHEPVGGLAISLEPRLGRIQQCRDSLVVAIGSLFQFRNTVL